MNKLAKFLVGVAALWIAPTLVVAQGGCVTDQNGKVVCGQPDSTCAANLRGELVCTKPGGGMMNDQNGEQLCGPGYCVREPLGNVLCSSQPRGGATVDQSGKAVCAGGCVPGTKEACVRPSK
jgi:hypothetical protein